MKKLVAILLASLMMISTIPMNISAVEVSENTGFDVYSVIAVGNGVETYLNGSNWNPCDPANAMTEVSDGIWEMTMEDIYYYDNYQIKFAANSVDEAGNPTSNPWAYTFGSEKEDAYPTGVDIDGVWSGKNCVFEVEEDGSKVKLQLDLRKFDYNTKQGAKFRITVVPSGMEFPTEEPTEEPITIESTTADPTDEHTTVEPTTNSHTIVSTGSTGNCTWTLDNEGTLTISGNGAMKNYSGSWATPWQGRNIKNIIIENGVTSIGDSAFYGCTGLTNIGFPDSVTSIGDFAFRNCTSLTSVEVPDSVTSIGDFAFSDCAGLTSIIGGNSITSVGNYSFSGCPASIGITGGCKWNRDGNGALTISGNGFMENYSTATNGKKAPWGTYIKSVVIENGVKNIGECAFLDCAFLTNVTIGNGVTSISKNAFLRCNGLISITISQYNKIYDSRNNCNAIIFTENNCLITGCNNTFIPDGVTSIGDGAFYGCTGLTSIGFPDSVTSIGDGAFSNCTGLTSLAIGKSITNIGFDAFCYCTNLTSVDVPDSVTSIGDFAFSNCTNLTTVTFGDSLVTIGENAFGYYYDKEKYEKIDGFTICCAPCSSACYYAIDNKFCYILNNCSGTTGDCIWTLDNEGNLTIVGNGVMCDYSTQNYNGTYITTAPWGTNIKNVIIENGVTSIGDYAFYGCTGLASIVFPDSVTSIGGNAFQGTAWLDNQPDGLIYAGRVAYKYRGKCLPNTSIEIQDGTKSIADSVFSDCAGLTNIDIPESVTSIGDYAFYGCTGLTRVDFPDSLTSIGDEAFFYCNSLTSLTIGNSVTSIGDEAFSYCNSLTSLTIGNSVTSIGDEAFSCCHSLTNVTIGNSVTSIGSYAFYDCNGLTSVEIPDSVTSIGDCAFGYYYKWGNEKVEGFTIYGVKGSEVERYANKNDYIFIAIDSEPETIIGDANGDNTVDILDAAAIQKHASGKVELKPEQFVAADVNGDGNVDVLDAAEIQKFAAGKITEFKKKA